MGGVLIAPDLDFERLAYTRLHFPHFHNVRKVSKTDLQHEGKRLPKATPETTTNRFKKEAKKSRFTKPDLEAFLSETETRLSKANADVLYSKVNTESIFIN